MLEGSCPGRAPLPHPRMHPSLRPGHRNSQTVKGVNFMGAADEWVVSGSDCGHIFVWDKRSGRLCRMVKVGGEGRRGAAHGCACPLGTAPHTAAGCPACFGQGVSGGGHSWCIPSSLPQRAAEAAASQELPQPGGRAAAAAAAAGRPPCGQLPGAAPAPHPHPRHLGWVGALCRAALHGRGCCFEPGKPGPRELCAGTRCAWSPLCTTPCPAPLPHPPLLT